VIVISKFLLIGYFEVTKTGVRTGGPDRTPMFVKRT
jgi:hypothetical protein